MTAHRRPALDAATVVLSLIVAGVGVWTIFAGPTELLPIHWNASGEADDWGPRELVGGLLVGMAALTLALGLGMGLFARRADDPARARALRYAQLAAVLIAALWSVFESWRVWRTDPDRQPF